MSATQQACLGYGAVASAAVTWNPSDKGANITLSNGNLTSTWAAASGYHEVRATLSRVQSSGGKFYFEVSVTTGNSGSLSRPTIGISTSAESLNDFVASGNGGIGYSYSSSGAVITAGGVATTYSTYTSGDVIGVAVDMGVSNGKIWFAKNNTFNGSPTAGTGNAFTVAGGSTFFPAAAGEVNVVVVGRFKTADFTYTPPTGFSSWE
jgi:hypothetical protein